MLIHRQTLRQSTLGRFARLFALVVVIWTIVEVLTIRSAIVREQNRSAAAASSSSSVRSERIFIASLHWTDEPLLRTHWIPAVLDLIGSLGRDNVYLSVYESGSLDDTKGALRDLHQALQDRGFRGKVVLDETLRQDVTAAEPAEEGWVQMPRDKWVFDDYGGKLMVPKGKWVPRRIPYLAGLRNRVLEPLWALRSETGEVFDRVLFLNDVVFQINDIQRLLSTRNGDYAAACSLDFKSPPTIYDSFALRDSQGYAPITNTWPYFRSLASVSAIKHAQPVPVSSCWNGMVAMDAAPFYNERNKLGFRGVSDSLSLTHVEASECCLIHTDNPLSRSKGVWVNPNVRVGYSGSAYEAVTPRGSWLSVWAIAMGIWRNRVSRWSAWGVSVVDPRITKRLMAWRTEHPKEEESGEVCLVSEMQVLLWNGWAHV